MRQSWAAMILATGPAAWASTEMEAMSLQSTSSRSIRQVTGDEGMQEIAEMTMSEEFCGVIGEVDDSGHARKHSRVIKDKDCDKSLLTNCTVSYWPLKCPATCPFLVKDPAVSCFFKCTKEETCSKENLETPWPDDSSSGHGICAECNITLCKLCSSDHECKQCHKGFEKSDDGQTCTLALNLSWLNYTVMVLAVILVCVVVLGIVWECVRGRHVRADQHMVACRRARLHRHLCKTADWELDSRRRVREWWSLSENVHTANIVGVGLPLWYNSLCFMMLVGLTFCAATFVLHRWYSIGASFGLHSGHHVLEFVERHHGGVTIFEDDQKQVIARRPALIVSSLRHCDGVDPEVDNRELEDMSIRTFFMMVFLYICLFGMSIWIGFKQKREAVEFDAEHATMADYVLRVEGIPTDQTDEADIAEYFEKHFRELIPDLQKRPKKTIFGHEVGSVDKQEHVEASQIQVHGVSLCYNFTNKRDVVDDAIWKLIEVQEVEFFEDAKEHAQNDTYLEQIYEDHKLQISDTSLYDPKDEKTHDMKPADAHDIIRSKVESLFSGENKLQITGEAYIIFKYIKDRELIEDYTTKYPHKIVWKNGEKLTFSYVFSEPPSICWWACGLSPSDVTRRAIVALCRIFIVILLMELCINLPYYLFIQKPYRDVGATATGLVTTVYGIVVGNVNGLIFWGIYMIGEGIGFHRKDALYQFVAVTSVFFITIMTAINIVLNAQQVVAKYDTGDAQGFLGDVSVKRLGVEIAFCQAIYNMLPGAMFAGSIAKLVMPQLMYIWVQVLQKIIYVWRCLPDALLNILKVFLPYKPDTLEHFPFRNAEKGVDPWEIPVMGDYADWVAIPMLCFFMLMYMSTYVWKIFRLMFFWSLFHYFYFRYTHLRYHRINFFTTHRLNTVGMYLWGGAMATVAAMIPLWGFRAGFMGPLQDWPTWAKIGIVILTWVAAVLVWLPAYHYAVDPWIHEDAEEHDKTKEFDDIRHQFVFSWLNTNPVYVLKCKYFFQDQKGKDIPGRRKDHPLACGEDPNQVRFFEVGKEYLFLRPERVHLLMSNLTDFMEPEYWIDRASWRLGQISSWFSARRGKKETQPPATESTASAEPLMNVAEEEA